MWYTARVEFGRAQFELVTVRFCVCVLGCSVHSQPVRLASFVCLFWLSARCSIGQRTSHVVVLQPEQIRSIFFLLRAISIAVTKPKKNNNNKWKVFNSSVFATLLPAIDRSGSSAVLLCYPNCVPRVAFRTFALLCKRNIKVFVVVAANRGRVVDVSVFRVGKLLFSKIECHLKINEVNVCGIGGKTYAKTSLLLELVSRHFKMDCLHYILCVFKSKDS